MQFETRNLADLRPAEYNPRKKLTPEDPESSDGRTTNGGTSLSFTAGKREPPTTS